MSNIQSAINELHQAFGKLNHIFFEGELPEPAILIMSQGKRDAFGWCTTKEIWSDQEGLIKKYEINISAEYLNRPYMEIMRTLLHEMVHLYNAKNGIQDCSRGGTYHNKRFKLQAEIRGFQFAEKPDKKYGWSFCELTQKAKDVIDSFGIDPDAFKIARLSEGGGEGSKKPVSYKWVCHDCEVNLRSTKYPLNIVCGDCGQHFICENPPEDQEGDEE